MKGHSYIRLRRLGLEISNVYSCVDFNNIQRINPQYSYRICAKSIGRSKRIRCYMQNQFKVGILSTKIGYCSSN